jgi:drug/metabolite transporter (DMT)-like permease
VGVWGVLPMAAVDSGPSWPVKAGMAGALVFINVAGGMASRFAQEDDRTYSFQSETMVLLAELIKIGICLFFLARSGEGLTENVTLGGFFKFGVPGAIYFVCNNLLIYSMRVVEPGQFNLLLQTRILYTVGLMYVFLGRRFTRIQMIAAVMLFTGSIVTNSENHCDEEKQEQASAGLVLSQVYAVLSASAGVYSEALLKFDGSSKLDAAKSSIHKQNLQLYIWGVLFNGIVMFSKSPEVVFGGIGPAALSVSLTMAFTGLIVSAVLKYLDNIIKISATSMSSGVMVVLSMYIFDAPLSVHVLLGFLIISCNAWLYADAGMQTVRPKAPTDAERGNEE